MGWEFISSGLSGTECLDHSEKKCLGAELKRQKLAEQEKESKSGTSKDNRTMGTGSGHANLA